MQWMLAIDTCGAEGGVAVAENGRIIAQRRMPARETQELLMLSIADCLKEAGVTAQQLDRIAVTTGPGSFTGVRIGLAAAKGLAEALQIPIVAVSRLLLMAKQGTTAFLDASRGDVYAGGEEMVESLLSREAAIALPGKIVVGEEPLRSLGEWVQVPTVVDLVEATSQSKDFADIALLDANYLRLPDAEVALRERQ